jgi:hypothetical protein
MKSRKEILNENGVVRQTRRKIKFSAPKTTVFPGRRIAPDSKFSNS